MDELRRVRQGTAFQYKGQLVTPIFYYKGNSDLVHSWDIAVGRLIISKAMPDEQRKAGFTEQDMAHLNYTIQRQVNAMEGRPNNVE